MRRLLKILVLALTGEILSSCGILPYYLSPYFSIVFFVVLLSEKGSVPLYTCIFILGIFHDTFHGFPPGTTSTFLLLIYPAVKFVFVNFYFNSPFAWGAYSFSISALSSLFLLILPGPFPLNSGEVILKSLLTGAWTPLLRFLTQTGVSFKKRGLI